MKRIATKFSIEDTAESETIHPYCLAPWDARLRTTSPERDKAIEGARTTTEGIVYVDASFRKVNIGVGLYSKVQRNGRTVEYRSPHWLTWSDYC